MEQARTAKARFLKPWSETGSVESRLRQELRFLACTAKACLYFLAAARASFDAEMLGVRGRAIGWMACSMSEGLPCV